MTQNHLTFKDVLSQKGQEYAPFDKTRVHRIYAVLKPHLNLKCKIIHIIGTNGKGSTGRFLTMGLIQHKKSVLHFSSPHIFCFNERFFVNGRDVSDEDLESAHKYLYAIPEVRESSYFEYATFLALFLAQECDYLVLEAGVGGEFDSTSVVKADLSIFTMIGYDHKEMLGENLSEIASTKLRTMGNLAILAKQEYPIISNIAMAIAEKRGAKLLLNENSALLQNLPYMEAFCAYCAEENLPIFLRENLFSAMRALDIFGMKFDFSTLGRLNLRGRCEQLTPYITIDVGHNVDGARAIRRHFRHKKVILVYNSYAQKDIEAILSELLPIIKKVLIICTQNYRIIPRKQLCNILKSLGLVYETFDISQLKEKQSYLVFGSFSVVEEFLKLYQLKITGEFCE